MWGENERQVCGMNTEQILKVLKNERECIKRQSGVEAPDGSVGICDRNCAKCDLCLPDTEILEVYDFLIEAYSITEIHINISKEEYARAYMKEVKNTFFGGSFASLVSFFAKDEQLSDEEVNEIMEILKNRK